MKIAIIHLSDFHIQENCRICSAKLNALVSALSVLGNVDHYVIAFSGDLAASGKINEYRTARTIFPRIFSGIRKRGKNVGFIPLLMVPGNHDLTLPNPARDRQFIQEHYDNGTIEDILPTELKYLDNFYTYSDCKGQGIVDRVFAHKVYAFGTYKIQFNLVNSAPFSTLVPDDKELHFFPSDKLPRLQKGNDADLCITIMHHNHEWFNWRYRTDLAKAIVDSSEILCIGHDHHPGSQRIAVDNSMDTWVSTAGEMHFDSIDKIDSFNTILIDTEVNTLTGIVFTWNRTEKIYTHAESATNRPLQKHSPMPQPLDGFMETIYADTYNVSPDFRDYFVFPKLSADYQEDADSYQEIKTADDLFPLLTEKAQILISGATSSGKTTLLKYLYAQLTPSKCPLFLPIDTHTKLKASNFVKRLFLDQYGDDPILYERFQQLDKSDKILLVDGWDLLDTRQNIPALIEEMERNFGCVVFSVGVKERSLVDRIKENLEGNGHIYELRIKPFFLEKRNELVRQVCAQKNIYKTEDVDKVNHLIDRLVQNNSDLFALNPAFIVRYTNYFITTPYHDYAQGEAVFSKVFESELQQSIIRLASRSDVDEVFAAFEEVAGNMYLRKTDDLPIETFREIIDNYNTAYGLSVSPKVIIDIGMQAKIFKQTDDMHIYFANKNYFAYFIAKHLILSAQNDPPSTDGIQYALKNICFGINSDIILFVSYLLNNTQVIMSILNEADSLLSPWPEVSLDNKNISLLAVASASKEITPPTADEQQEYSEQKETLEERHYSGDEVEARGLFDYDDSEIDKYPYRLIRAIRYTEMICRALPAFHSRLKVSQKSEIIDFIYSYPRKIIYALLRPIDTHIDELCDMLLAYAAEAGKKKSNGSDYTHDDFQNMFFDYARAASLSLYNHFAEICTSPKTTQKLVERDSTDAIEKIARLLIIENSGNTDELLKEAEAVIKHSKDMNTRIMAQIVVRKHLLYNKKLSFSKKQQLVDRIFGKSARKTLLSPSRTS